MNKSGLVATIAEATQMTKKDAGALLSAVTSSIIEAVADGDKVTLVGFGTFEARDRQEREGYNPRTGKAIRIPATKSPIFSAGKTFREMVVKTS